MSDPDLQAVDCDVAVIGGGPAGSTMAMLLQERGWRVVLLEKQRHPRFHIGESLLPMNLALFEHLGILEQVRRIGVRKPGAEFVSSADANRRTTYFSRAEQRTGYAYAFHVRRAEFDHLLFETSRARGVDAREGINVTGVDLQPGASRLQAHDDQARALSFRARYVVDASGRDTLLARQLQLKRKDPKHQSAAVFGHFENVPRSPGADGGNISVYWFKNGWLWMIPLPDRVMSIGAVCWPEHLKTRANRSLERFLRDTVALCPEAARRMRDARACDEVRAAGNYSYRARRMHGDGYCLIGDAYTFVDPVFSTGVFLAMQSAAMTADAVDAWLRDPKQAAPLFKRCEMRLNSALGVVSWFIYRFTSPAMRHLFLTPRDVAGIEQAVVAMLAGDLFCSRGMRLPLALFKAIYFVNSAAMLSHSWAEYRRRKRSATSPYNPVTASQDNTP